MALPEAKPKEGNLGLTCYFRKSFLFVVFRTSLIFSNAVIFTWVMSVFLYITVSKIHFLTPNTWRKPWIELVFWENPSYRYFSGKSLVFSRCGHLLLRYGSSNHHFATSLFHVALAGLVQAYSRHSDMPNTFGQFVFDQWPNQGFQFENLKAMIYKLLCYVEWPAPGNWTDRLNAGPSLEARPEVRQAELAFYLTLHV